MAKVSLREYNRDIEAMIDRGHLDEAIAHCQHILKIYPKHLETYRLLGKAYLEAKRHDEAVDIFSRVLVAEPSDFVAQVGMSIIRDEQDKYDDAIWHMERAFETQPSNAAIQGELQRLYGRRDGVQPPRIRMTRGALAHMYMQGELYPQAISETKGVLEEDGGRSDMQALLAKAYFKSGHKNDAADTASAILKRYPYCLDANRVLTEILGIDRPESAEVYRKRVFELDPYASQVNGSVFQSGEVSDAAVMLEKLDWNGQPTGMSSDWGSTNAISLESGSPGEQPDWLKNGFSETTSPPPAAPAFAPEQDTSALSQASTPAEPAEDIPDFLRAAGWGESTGAFDESKSSVMFDDEPVSEAQPIEQGDMPDWVKAMAPQADSTPAAADEEEIPDWINKIGTGELPVPNADSLSDDQSDWLNQVGDESLSSETQFADDRADLLSQPDIEAESPASSQPMDNDADFLKSLKSDEPEQTEQIVEISEERSAMPDEPENLGMGEQEQDDSFAWLEKFAAKQGATEGLLTDSEERLEDEPDWVKQAKSLNESSGQSPVDELQPEPDIQSEPELPAEPAPAPASANVEDLGKSDEERDDSFSWLENLAAKQGATEGLLTKPEDRLEDEPEWVKQAKSSDAPPTTLVQDTLPPIEEPIAESEEASPAQIVEPMTSVPDEPEETPPPVTEPVAEFEETPEQVPPSVVAPAANLEDLGMSDEERDDSFSWLENLAAKQGATEGLLTKPEDRLEDEPEWVKRAKSSDALPSTPVHDAQEESLPPVIEPVAEVEETTEQVSTPEAELPSMAEEPTQTEDVNAWLNGLEEEDEAEQQQPEPSGEDDTNAWLKSLDEPEPEKAPVPEASNDEDVLAWLEKEDTSAAESTVHATETGEESSDDLPDWLGGLVEDESKDSVATSSGDDLPAWMRDDTGELVAEPTKIEPTRPNDWTPTPTPDSEAKPVVEPEVKPAPTPKPVSRKPEPQKMEEVKPATPREPYKEPVTRKTTGMLEMPVDPILGSARAELNRSNIPGALETYGKLIKKGRFLEDVIYDLRDALYRYPVEVSIWQSLGDAYMRANQLQDALDAYTKAEELLR